MIFNILFSYPANLAGQSGFLSVVGDTNTLLLADRTPYIPNNGCEYKIVDVLDLRAEKVITTSAEALRRIQTTLPGLVSISEVELIRELWLSIALAARLPTANFSSATNIYNYARDKIAWIKDIATDAEVDVYDPTTDPSWPA